MDAAPRFVSPARFDFGRRIEIFVRPFSFPLPDFIVEEGDYRLAGTSLLIDEGSLEDAPPIDLAGEARPCGSGIDIGAFENCLIAGAALFVRSDSNEDGRGNISDAISILDYLFLGGSAPGCLSSADANDDGAVDCSDPIFLFGHLFLGTSAPGAPALGCGEDPTTDTLACSTQPACLDD